MSDTEHVWLEENISAAMSALRVSGSDSEVAGIGQVIRACMSGPARDFHSLDHILDVCAGLEDPICQIAGLFHDTIYTHVDAGLPAINPSYFVAFPEITTEGVATIGEECSRDRLVKMVAAIFGFSKDQKISHREGLNEYLSALLAGQLFKKHLRWSEIAQIAACIEATIPFRADQHSNGTNVLENLYERLRRVNLDFSLNLSEQELKKSIHRAVQLSNQDVRNFRDENPAAFLKGTWSLLAETNHALRVAETYTVGDYQSALEKMAAFFAGLEPSTIFTHFRSVPSPENVQKMQEEAAKNIEIATAYLEAKLAGINTLAAFASLSGGDAPISSFLGPIDPAPKAKTETQLGLEPTSPPAADCRKEVLNLLLFGRKDKSRFDLSHSPLSGYLYTMLGSAGCRALMRSTLRPDESAMVARQWLKQIPKDMVSVCATALAQVATDRREAFEVLALGESSVSVSPCQG